MEKVSSVLSPNGTQIKSIQPIPFGQCSSDSYNIRNISFQNLNEQFKCTNDFTNLTLGGEFLSDTFQYIRIRLLPCNQQTDNLICASETDIRNYFYLKNFSYFYKNTYFNP